MAPRRARWFWAIVAVPVVAAMVVGASALGSGSGAVSEPPAPVVDLAATDAVEVSSLEDLVAAAECVLRGEVVHTERGRVIAAGLVSRLVQIRVDEALVGECPSGTVVLEEEGWLDDGTEVTVDGWPGSEVGDRGVWFLVPGGSDELPYAATVTTTGALRWRRGESVAPGTAPVWLLGVVDEGPERLTDRLRALA